MYLRVRWPFNFKQPPLFATNQGKAQPS